MAASPHVPLSSTPLDNGSGEGPLGVGQDSLCTFGRLGSEKRWLQRTFRRAGCSPAKRLRDTPQRRSCVSTRSAQVIHILFTSGKRDTAVMITMFVNIPSSIR